MTPDYTLTQKDLPGATQFTLTDADGTIVDLTLCTAVTFSMRGVDDTLAVDAGPASVSGTPTLGKVTYTWGSGDTDTPGLYWGEFHCTFSDGRLLSFPTDPKLLIHIVDNVAA